MTAPDNVLVSGRLANGGVASLHVAANPWVGSGYRMEVYGREGTLVASGPNSPQLVDIQLQGAKAGENCTTSPSRRNTRTCRRDAQGEPYHVGQMYALFGQAIRSGKPVSQISILR